MIISQYVAIAMKLFFLLTPFFVLSMFLAMTCEMEQKEQRRVAKRTGLACLCLCCFIYFFGEFFFYVMGITLDAFRIGAGVVLFLTAIDLVSGKMKVPEAGSADIAVVPLSIPVTIGPGTIGALLLMGMEATSLQTRLIDCAGMLTGVGLITLLLYYAGHIERWLGRRNITILSKLTGLILAALAAQLIFTGVVNFLDIKKAVREAIVETIPLERINLTE